MGTRRRTSLDPEKVERPHEEKQLSEKWGKVHVIVVRWKLLLTALLERKKLEKKIEQTKTKKKIQRYIQKCIK